MRSTVLVVLAAATPTLWESVTGWLPSTDLRALFGRTTDAMPVQVTTPVPESPAAAWLTWAQLPEPQRVKTCILASLGGTRCAEELQTEDADAVCTALAARVGLGEASAVCSKLQPPPTDAVEKACLSAAATSPSPRGTVAGACVDASGSRLDADPAAVSKMCWRLEKELTEFLTTDPHGDPVPLCARFRGVVTPGPVLATPRSETHDAHSLVTKLPAAHLRGADALSVPPQLGEPAAVLAPHAATARVTERFVTSHGPASGLARPLRKRLSKAVSRPIVDVERVMDTVAPAHVPNGTAPPAPRAPAVPKQAAAPRPLEALLATLARHRVLTPVCTRLAASLHSVHADSVHGGDLVSVVEFQAHDQQAIHECRSALTRASGEPLSEDPPRPDALEAILELPWVSGVCQDMVLSYLQRTDESTPDHFCERYQASFLPFGAGASFQTSRENAAQGPSFAAPRPDASPPVRAAPSAGFLSTALHALAAESPLQARFWREQ